MSGQETATRKRNQIFYLKGQIFILKGISDICNNQPVILNMLKACL
jgi:hypothetical protein